MSPSPSTPLPPHAEDSEGPFDFSFVDGTARIAIYDDLRSAPRLMEIPPAETGAYIEKLASTIYNEARLAGGSIPYTVVREVSENFIHARFKEIIVSIMDGGNTIRFADQGPGIPAKEKAQLPGFSSAIEPMKSYIRGVGSGLPIVRDYLEVSRGSITIEDNLNSGSVITISLVKNSESSMVGSAAELSQGVATSAGTSSAGAVPSYPDPVHPATPAASIADPYSGMAPQAPAAYYPPAAPTYQAPVGYAPAAPPYPSATPAYPYPAGGHTYQPALGHTIIPHLNENARTVLQLLYNEGGPMRITDICQWGDIPPSSAHKILTNLEQEGLVTRDPSNSKHRMLTELGQTVAQGLQD